MTAQDAGGQPPERPGHASPEQARGERGEHEDRIHAGGAAQRPRGRHVRQRVERGRPEPGRARADRVRQQLRHHAAPENLFGERDDADDGGDLRRVLLQDARIADLAVERHQPHLATGAGRHREMDEGPRESEEDHGAEQAPREVAPFRTQPLAKVLFAMCPEGAQGRENERRPPRERPESHAARGIGREGEIRRDARDDHGERDEGGSGKAHAVRVNPYTESRKRGYRTWRWPAMCFRCLD